jgi:tetratricopeptide (TPR) repeat protein
VKHQFLAGSTQKPGHYRLVLDIYPSSGPAVETRKAVEPQKGSPEKALPQKPPEKVELTAVETKTASPSAQAPSPAASEPLSPPTSDQLFNLEAPAGNVVNVSEGAKNISENAKIVAPLPSARPMEEAGKAFKKGDYARAYALYDQALKGRPTAQEKVDALYGLADSFYEMHREALTQYGSQIVDHYLNALRTAPKAPQAPVATYRCGLSYAAIGSSDRAKQCFEYVISNHPNHPLVGPSWLGLGRLGLEKSSPSEAMLAFKSALNFPMEKSEMAEAYYGLGKNLSLLNEHRQAVETMKNCLSQDPLFYRKQPDTFKYYGESLFGIQQYSESQKYLLWYLNLQPASPDRDIVLARIAETLSHEGDEKLVKKLQTYIQNNYPNSEGATIAQIRRAETLEKANPKSLEAARIYEELSALSLSEPLLHLVRLKLASLEWRNGNYEKSLAIIDNMLNVSKNEANKKEFASLRDKVIVDWTKKAFEEKDYAKVLHFYMENMPLFQSLQSSEIDAMLGESYGALKLYPNALESYQRVLARDGDKVNEEVLLKMAEYAFHMRDMAKAEQLALQARSPALDRSRTELLAQINYAREEYPKAVEYFEKLLPKDRTPEDAVKDYLLQYTESLMKVGKYEQALFWVQKGISLTDQGNPELLVQLHLLESQCYVNLNQKQKALESLEGAIPLVVAEDLKNRLNYELSGLYLENGQKDMAVQKLTELSASSQSFWRAAAEQRLNNLQLQN